MSYTDTFDKVSTETHSTIKDPLVLRTIFEHLTEYQLIPLLRVNKKWYENVYLSIPLSQDSLRTQLMLACYKNKPLRFGRLLRIVRDEYDNDEIYRESRAELLYHVLEVACETGRTLFIKHLLKMEASLEVDSNILRCAFKSGKMSIILMIDEKVLDYDHHDYLEEACIRGDIEVVQYAIDLRNDHNWNHGLALACYYGHNNLIKYFVERGATDVESALQFAAQGNEAEICSQLIDDGASNLNESLFWACSAGAYECVSLLLERGATRLTDCLYEASISGSVKTVELLLTKQRFSKDELDECLKGSIRNGRITIAKYFLENKVCTIDPRNGLIYSAGDPLGRMIDYFIERGATNFYEAIHHTINYKTFIKIYRRIPFNERVQIQWDKVLFNACKEGHLKLVRLAIQEGGAKNDLYIYLSNIYGHPDIVKELLNHYHYNDGEKHLQLF